MNRTAVWGLMVVLCLIWACSEGPTTPDKSQGEIVSSETLVGNWYGTWQHEADAGQGTWDFSGHSLQLITETGYVAVVISNGTTLFRDTVWLSDFDGPGTWALSSRSPGLVDETGRVAVVMSNGTTVIRDTIWLDESDVPDWQKPE